MAKIRKMPEDFLPPVPIRDPVMVRRLNEELNQRRRILLDQMEALKSAIDSIKRIHPENITAEHVMQFRQSVLEVLQNHYDVDESIYEYYETIDGILDIFVGVSQTSKNIEKFLRQVGAL